MGFRSLYVRQIVDITETKSICEMAHCLYPSKKSWLLSVCLYFFLGVTISLHFTKVLTLLWAQTSSHHLSHTVTWEEDVCWSRHLAVLPVYIIIGSSFKTRHPRYYTLFHTQRHLSGALKSEFFRLLVSLSLRVKTTAHEIIRWFNPPSSVFYPLKCKCDPNMMLPHSCVCVCVSVSTVYMEHFGVILYAVCSLTCSQSLSASLVLQTLYVWWMELFSLLCVIC